MGWLLAFLIATHVASYAVPVYRRAQETRRIARMIGGWHPSQSTGLRGDYEERRLRIVPKPQPAPFDWEVDDAEG